MSPNTVKKFQKIIWAWYRNHAPTLPWRETHNPYHIFVSEVMLQQTQIPRVAAKYPLFLKTFPSVEKLAKAPLRTVLARWQGMGYNRRGLYLKKAAERMVTKHGGKIPRTIDELDTLPGIGPYSARAIACFAYNTCEPFIETNIRRVIIHEFFPKKKLVTDADILRILAAVEPARKTREWYWALMDYGREGLKRKPNANRRSKHYSKQSKFEGSTRQLRAEILGILLKKKRVALEELLRALADKWPRRDYKKILKALAREGFIISEKHILRIK